MERVAETRAGSIMWSEGREDIGLPEVVALEQKRLAGDLSERISEAIAEIQPRRVAAFAEVMEGLARDLRLLDGDRLDYHANSAEQRVALPEDVCAELALYDDREFEEIAG